MAVDPSLLVVEDDPRVAGELVRGLKAAGFRVELATRGALVVPAVIGGSFDALILDWMLPDASGEDLLRAVTQRRRLPVLVLTARTDLATRLRAFDAGAVDFLGKPFFIEELIARLRARIGAPPAPEELVVFLDVTLDLRARRVRGPEGDIALTRHELDILAYLAARPGRAISRAHLAEHALSSADGCEPRTIDSHVSRLRRKLGAAGAAIAPVWGIGYRFDGNPGEGSAR
jgi:DNA-binding response OmpR family regulator